MDLKHMLLGMLLRLDLICTEAISLCWLHPIKAHASGIAASRGITLSSTLYDQTHVLVYFSSTLGAFLYIKSAPKVAPVLVYLFVLFCTAALPLRWFHGIKGHASVAAASFQYNLNEALSLCWLRSIKAHACGTAASRSITLSSTLYECTFRRPWAPFFI